VSSQTACVPPVSVSLIPAVSCVAGTSDCSARAEISWVRRVVVRAVLLLAGVGAAWILAAMMNSGQAHADTIPTPAPAAAASAPAAAVVPVNPVAALLSQVQTTVQTTLAGQPIAAVTQLLGDVPTDTQQLATSLPVVGQAPVVRHLTNTVVVPVLQQVVDTTTAVLTDTTIPGLPGLPGLSGLSGLPGLPGLGALLTDTPLPGAGSGQLSFLLTPTTPTPTGLTPSGSAPSGSVTSSLAAALTGHARSVTTDTGAADTAPLSADPTAPTAPTSPVAPAAPGVPAVPAPVSPSTPTGPTSPGGALILIAVQGHGSNPHHDASAFTSRTAVLIPAGAMGDGPGFAPD
jgi:hypothetical protein